MDTSPDTTRQMEECDEMVTYRTVAQILEEAKVL